MEKLSLAPGLYVAATPIGHLADITDRVRAALSACDIIFAEDTRRTFSLIQALGIHRPAGSVRPLHQHNERDMMAQVLEELALHRSVMLVSDAGTPAISDPGFMVVDAAWKAGYLITPLPGASAVTAALSICGFARWPVSFWGFAPARPVARRAWLQELQRHGGVAVIFETPHRAEASLADCEAVLGADTSMMFGREITKHHETLLRGSIRDVRQRIAHLHEQDQGSAKGEMVWVFDLGEAGPREREHDRHKLKEWAALLGGEMSAAAAARCLVKMLGVPRDEAYDAVMLAHQHQRGKAPGP